MNQIFLGLLDRLADRHGHFTRLAHPESCMASLVTDDDERRKTEVLASLDDLGHALYGHHLVFQAVGVDLEVPPDRQCFPENLFGHKLRISTPLLRTTRP